jgi:hypothetical protein
MTIEQLRKMRQYEDEILEVIDIRLRNDKYSMTQSDLQGAIQAIVRKIITDTANR